MVANTNRQTLKDAVVLVHGLMANSLIMKPLATAFTNEFAPVVNWGYESLWSPIERHGNELARQLEKLDREITGRIHLVTHSMGGIIGRLALREYRPQRLGRFVMITPPNRGSHVASWLAPYFGRFFPPIQQLSDCEASFVCSLDPPQGTELGVIAAESDFLVSESSTRLGCEADHITLPGLHSSLLVRKETAEQIKHFILHGRFKRDACIPAMQSSEAA